MNNKSRAARLTALLLLLSFVAFGEALTRAQEGGGSSSSVPTANRPRRAEQTNPAPTPPPPPAPSPSPNNDADAMQDDEVVRVETDLTNMLFTAVDRNRRFVTTLRREDIRVLEDGAPQEIFTFERQTDLPLSLAIVIDRSASQQFTLPSEKSAAQAFISAVVRPMRDETAVITFTGEVVLEQGLTGNVARVQRAIDRIEYVPPSGVTSSGTSTGTPPISGRNQTLAGSTALWDSVWVTSEEVLSTTSDRTRRAIILLTDGVDTSSQLRRDEAIDRAVRADVTVYAIGIGDTYNYSIDQGALRRVSERTGGRAFFPRDEAELQAAFAQIQQELRSQYLVAYSPTNRTRDGRFRQVRIEVINPELTRQNLRLTYRQGYFARGGSTSSPAPSRGRP